MHDKPSAPRVVRRGGKPRPPGAALLLAMLLPALWGAVALWAAGQEPDKKPPAAPAADKEKKDDKEKPRPPQDVTLSTSDGVQIVATYFPGTKGKESVPVVLLHVWKRSRKDYNDLALHLQSQGCAVLVPDLRGHGDSTVGAGTKAKTLDAAKFSTPQFALMATADMKAVKDYLWERHNAGELNLNKLGLVGAEMGATVAVEFSFGLDAAGYGEGDRPGRPYYGGLQVGRFVKALVLLSPEWAFKGLHMGKAMADKTLRGQLAVMLLVGAENPKALADAKAIHKLFKPYHLEPEGENKVERKTLFLGSLDTSLQGTKLLDAKELHVRDHIAQFIYLRLVKGAEAGWAWKVLKKPHQ
jgi:pimeloyl-ACP methyl ester carboxylesterase